MISAIKDNNDLKIEDNDDLKRPQEQDPIVATANTTAPPTPVRP
jgi:hypothetical protein